MKLVFKFSPPNAGSPFTGIGRVSSLHHKVFDIAVDQVVIVVAARTESKEVLGGRKGGGGGSLLLSNAHFFKKNDPLQLLWVFCHSRAPP